MIGMILTVTAVKAFTIITEAFRATLSVFTIRTAQRLLSMRMTHTATALSQAPLQTIPLLVPIQFVTEATITMRTQGFTTSIQDTTLPCGEDLSLPIALPILILNP